ncbi:MAG: AMIN domain-containing protein [Desulfovibrio sp.]|nr:AMIN domain-containing protein [Desulfovibrio sp.]MBI4961597.1 AMIN domain-containing protein [Desulfovibrio sp.]
MALTRNDKMLILAALLLAALVVGGLAWWRTSGKRAEPAPGAASPQTAQLPPIVEHKVQVPQDAKPPVVSPLTPPAPSIPAAPPVEPDKSLQGIFAEQPAPEPMPEVLPPPEPEKAPANTVEPEKPKKKETPAERKARLAAERKAAAEAKKAEEEAKKARAETLRRAQEELRKAEADLKRAQAQAKSGQAAPAAVQPEPPAPATEPAKPEAAPEAKPAPKPEVKIPEKPAPERRVVDKLTVSETGEEVIITLQGASTSSKPEALLLGAPPRLVIDLPGAWSYKSTDKPAGSLVKAVRVGTHPEKLRLVLDLANPPKGPKHPAVEKTSEGLVIKLGK